MEQKMKLQVLRAGGYSLNANKEDDELLLPPEVERDINKPKQKPGEDLLLPPGVCDDCD